MKKLKLAVVGKDVSRSLSPAMHTFILENLGVGCSYETVSVAESDFAALAPRLFEKYDDFNVTIPFKLSVIPFLDEICGDAAVFGAVNTVDARNKKGYNTDGMGFLLMLRNNGVETAGKSVLVLGSGGVGRSVIKKLLDAGAKVFAYDLNRENLQKVHDEFPAFTPLESVEAKPYDVIINCTGVGMHRTEGISPVGGDLLSLCQTAVDLIYVPAKSEFLRIAESLGKKIVNGEAMLFYQAYFSDCIYLGIEPSDETAKRLFEKYKEKNV